MEDPPETILKKMNESSNCSSSSKENLLVPNNSNEHDETLCKGCKRWNCPCGYECEVSFIAVL